MEHNVVVLIREEVKKRCELYYEKNSLFHFWNDHIQYVVKNAITLAKLYGADVEIVTLGALLHDIAMPSEVGPSGEHHINGEKIAEELLTQLHYPKEKTELVKKCVRNHRGSHNVVKNSIEEQCVADADAMAHFDCIPVLFSMVYREYEMPIYEGAEYVRQKLERSYLKLSNNTKKRLQEQYENIMKSLFPKQ